MHDIRLAMGLIGFLSVGLFFLTVRLLKNRARYWTLITAVITIALIVVYSVTIWGQLWIVQWIPLPSVIVLSNWFPLLLGVLAGAVWVNLAQESVARALPIMVLIVAGAIYSVMRFVPTEPPQCDDVWSSAYHLGLPQVCRQTTNFTCSAASAATILRMYGIHATEQEMAKLCLTRSGTTWLGLYHGLMEKLADTDFTVEFFEGDVSQLSKIQSNGPALLCCELTPSAAKLLPAYKEEGGWQPGVAHTVVYFGHNNQYHVVGDPSRGHEVWSDRDLNLLWSGQGLRIVKR